MAERRSKGEGCLIRPSKTSKVWFAQFYAPDGTRKRISTGEHTKAKALVELRRLMGKSESGEVTAHDLKKIHYGDLRQLLLDNYEDKENRTLKTRADGTATIDGLHELDQFYGWTAEDPGWPVSRITTESTRSFARHRLKGTRRETVGTATVNRALALLRRMFYLAKEQTPPLIPYVPKVIFKKEPAPRKGFVDQTRFDRLLALLPTHLKPLVAFLYYCGVRKNEALQLDWSQYDPNTGRHGVIRVTAEQAKNKDGRTVPLHSEVAMLLREIEAKTGKIFDETNLRSEWERACAAAGEGTRVKRTMESKPGAKRKRTYVFHQYRGLMLHDLRRSAVRNLVRSGVHDRVVMSISGHKTRSVFDRYNISSEDDVVAAMDQLEQNGSIKGQGKTHSKTRKALNPASLLH